MHDEGYWVVETAEGLCAMANTYFSDLFKASSMMTLAPSLIFHTRVSRSENESLLISFTYDEFELAVKQMHLDKAPGPDGLNPSFYHKFWPVFGNDYLPCLYCVA